MKTKIMMLIMITEELMMNTKINMMMIMMKVMINNDYVLYTGIPGPSTLS